MNDLYPVNIVKGISIKLAGRASQNGYYYYSCWLESLRGFSSFWGSNSCHSRDFVLKTKKPFSENKEEYVELMKVKRWTGTVTRIEHDSRTPKPLLDALFPRYSPENNTEPHKYEAHCFGNTVKAKDVNGVWRKCSRKKFEFELNFYQKLEE